MDKTIVGLGLVVVISGVRSSDAIYLLDIISLLAIGRISSIIVFKSNNSR